MAYIVKSAYVTPNDCIRIFFKMKQEADPKDIFIKGVFIG